ncbi:MAG TPA: metallophosphoesterase [Candidatus Binatia bacterium]|jgi:hypothetical protein|nr:metallophosphoesterase [Candidatus Binatia bacterium]
MLDSGRGRSLSLLLLLLTALLLPGAAAAQTITRGPFVENPDAFSTTMTLQWWTNVAGDSTVEYGLTPGLGSTMTVPTAGSCEIGSAGTCHIVALNSLQPGTRYYYRLLTNGVEVQAVTYFTTLRTSIDPTPLKFAVIGDWGQGSSALTDVGNQQNAADPPFIITVGDNAYTNGTQSDWDNNALPALRNVMRRATFFPVLGNHDLNAVGAGSWANSVEIKMFRLPRNGGTGNLERWYSFDAGDAHFVALDSNDPNNSDQRAWLENDLATSTKRWKFVFFHHPPYSCASGLFSFGSYEGIRNNWSPLFEEYGVNVVFDGHDHIYERSLFMDQYTDAAGNTGSDGKGTYYIMTGGGGATLDGAASISGGVPRRSGTDCTWLANNCPGGPSGTNFCSFAKFSYTSVTLTNDQVLNIKAIDRNGVVFDDFTITRPSCGDGTVDLAASEQCDQGGANGAVGSCCSSTCGIQDAGTVCRGAVGICDVQETCDGVSGACPANGFAPNTLECRGTAGICDVAESCTGSSATCPTDVKSTAPCRSAVDLCDVAESCNGASNDCPVDGFASSAVTCRGSAGVCDLPETCTGSSAACPGDQKSTAPCRGSAGICDTAESCDGVNDGCPIDGFQSASVVCRGSAGDCDVADTCSGSSAACPPDAVQPSSVVCRGTAGDCDLAESCTGSSATCPADAKSTAVCRGAAGDCDLPESCNGTTNACPADAKSTTVCRPSAGLCDVAETCTGSSDACPVDAFQPSSLTCRISAGFCDVAETCTGSSAACPANAFQPSTLECRPSAGVCDNAETCTGSSPGCPSDAKSTSVCRGPAGDCDLPESCNGVANTCPADAKSTAICRTATGPCDIAESCSGSSDACPADTFQPAIAVCRVSVGFCDVADTCTGTSGACPADVFKPNTLVCRPSSGACDVPETCTGASSTCPPDTVATDTDSDGTCDAQDVCPAIPDPAQADGDSDGRGDACDPCTNLGPRFVFQTKITLVKIAAPGGDDRLKFTGSLNIPTTPPVNPIAKGLRLIMTDAAGGTILDTTVPAGAYDALTRAGWTVNGAGTAFTYKNAGTTVPLNDGIYKVSFKRQGAVGQYKFTIVGKNGTYPVPPTALPITATVIVDTPQATTGQCADAIFPGPKPAPTCTIDASGNTVKCR